MIIKNGYVLCDDFKFYKKDIAFSDGKITLIADEICGDEVIDASGKYVIPGLINIHTHGMLGFDANYSTYNELNEISVWHAKNGAATSFLPTIWTEDEAVLKKAVSEILGAMEKGTDGASILGINMEAVYLSRSHRGAHKEEYLKTPYELDFEEMQAAAKNNIRLLTIAPEIDGAGELIKKYSDKITVSLGHTGADYETCKTAYENGAKSVTHLFNAMPSVNHRNLSLISAAFESAEFAELICDGYHVKPSVCMMAYKLFGDERLCVITDSCFAMGLPDGEYDLKAGYVTLKDGLAINKEGTICGGTSSMLDCVKNLVKWGVSLESAVKMASANPAKCIDVYASKGSLSEGKDADIVIMDTDFDVSDVFVCGKKIK